MPDREAFRQVDEKHVLVEVDKMVWSPKFDLLALSNIQGEVILHRLSWQRVWSLAPPAEDVLVKAMSWRSDGKVLAVGYSTGKVNLCYIENADIVHTFNVSGEITYMSWVCQGFPQGKTWVQGQYQEDSTDNYLPKLPPLTKSYGNLSKGTSEEVVEDRKKLKDQKELNMLVIGCGQNTIHIYVYGVFPVATIKVMDHQGLEPQQILSAILSEDFQSLQVFLKFGRLDNQDHDYCVLTYDTKLLASRCEELRILALKYGQISTLIAYLEQTIQQMVEAWEDILMEMDAKLFNFAEQKQATGTGTVSNDFLELLLFGTPSSELQTFLQHELTDKGLKKLGFSIETSYSNIQKLVVKHLQSVSQAIVYHMSELKGMAMCSHEFGVLGLDNKSVHTALMAAGSFVLKTSELQQVIDASIKNFKAFFRWLYVVILRLSDEKPPQELCKMTQHDIKFVTDFLKDSFFQFDPKEEEESITDLRAISPTDRKPRFKMEKVGQYLKKEDLPYPPNISGNPWTQFCRANPTLKESTSLYPVENNKSLVQVQEKLERSLNAALRRPSVIIGQSMECVSSVYLFSSPSSNDEGKPFIPRIMQFTLFSTKKLYSVFTADFLPCKTMYIIRQPTDAISAISNMEIACIQIGNIPRTETDINLDSSYERCDNHHILDISYYDNKHISVLLSEDTEDGLPVLVQLPINLIPEESYLPFTGTAGVNVTSNIPVLTVGPLLDSASFRRLHNMRAHSFAVSGSRNTATVLFSSRRRVRIFLMDAEEEEDDDEDDDEGGISNQSETEFSSQSASSMQVDSSVADESQGHVTEGQGHQEEEDESFEGSEQEDKENTVMRPQGGEETPSTSNQQDL